MLKHALSTLEVLNWWKGKPSVYFRKSVSFVYVLPRNLPCRSSGWTVSTGSQECSRYHSCGWWRIRSARSRRWRLIGIVELLFWWYVCRQARDTQCRRRRQRSLFRRLCCLWRRCRHESEAGRWFPHCRSRRCRPCLHNASAWYRFSTWNDGANFWRSNAHGNWCIAVHYVFIKLFVIK